MKPLFKNLSEFVPRGQIVPFSTCEPNRGGDRRQLTCPTMVSPTGQVKSGRSWGAVSGDAGLGPADREMGGTEEHEGTGANTPSTR